MTDCGDRPGLVVPRVKLLGEVTKNLDRLFDALHIGTCVKLAMETSQCPIELDDFKITLEKKFGIDALIDTHYY